MRPTLLLLTPVLLLARVPTVRAADLAGLDRTIRKEPAYRSRPKYCLLVFGKEAATRVWLVLDGDTLYVDKNGNGDLTEAGERLTGTSREVPARPDYPFSDLREFPAVDVTGPAGGTPYQRLSVTHTAIKQDFPASDPFNRDLKARLRKNPNLIRAGVTVYLGGKVRQQAVAEWADRPADAPVLHLDGPLTMQPLHSVVLTRGDKPQEVQFCLGTPGLGEGSPFAILDYNNVPTDARPVAEFTFSCQDPAAPPIRVRLALDRC